MLIDRVQPVDSPDTGFMNAVGFTHVYSHQLKFHMKVRETYTGLEIWLQTECSPGRDGNKPGTVSVGPSKLAIWLTSRRGLISCERLLKLSSTMSENNANKECPWRGPISLQNIREAVTEQRAISLNDKTIQVLTYKDVPSAIAAIASTSELDPKYSIFIVGRECLTCCMKAVLAVDRPERTDFCIFRLPQ